MFHIDRTNYVEQVCPKCQSPSQRNIEIFNESRGSKVNEGSVGVHCFSRIGMNVAKKRGETVWMLKKMRACLQIDSLSEWGDRSWGLSVVYIFY